jgi:hypothetical protein
VLIEPVGHERAGDPFVPPRQGAHLLDPRLRDVPVVVDVVVVEDHRRRHSREKPADVGIRPGFAIQLGVLLEVGDLFPRWLADVPARADEGGHFRRDFVHVDLVAQEQQAVGPLRRAFLELAGVRP